MLTIFVVFSVVGFAYPLLASTYYGVGNFTGQLTSSKFILTDFTQPGAIVDSNYVEGGHFEVPTRGSLLGFPAYPGSTALLTAGTSSEVIYVTPQRRRVGMLVTVLFDSPSYAATTTYADAQVIASSTPAQHIVTYRLISNPNGGTNCASGATGSVTDQSLDGVASACPYTQLSNWQVVIPEITTANEMKFLTTIDGTNLSWQTPTGGGGASSTNIIVAPSSVGSYNATTTVLSINQAGTSTDGYLSSIDWNTFNAKLAATLADGNIFIGSASGTATSVSLHGDGTLSDTGLFSLISVGVATTTSYTDANITVDANGRVIAATSTIPNVGTVTEITAGAGLTGGFIMTSGTIALDLTNSNAWTGLQSFIGSLATSTFGTISIGNGGFGGIGSPNFIGSASGTQIAVNASSTFTGNLVDLQVAGTSTFSIDATGAIKSTSLAGGTLGANCVVANPITGQLQLGTCGSSGTIIGTLTAGQVAFAVASSTLGTSNDFTFANGTNPVFFVGDAGAGNGTSFALNDASSTVTIKGDIGSSSGGTMLLLNGSTHLFGLGDLSDVGNGTDISINDQTGVQSIFLNGSAYTTANNGLVSIGNGGFDGSSSGHFVGASSGTELAVNATSTFLGSLFNLQIGGLSRFNVDAFGSVTISTLATTTSNMCVTVDSNGKLGLTSCGSAAGLLGGGSPYAFGDMFYATGTSTLGRISLGTVGQVLVSTGTGTAPVWRGLTGFDIAFPNGATGTTKGYSWLATGTVVGGVTVADFLDNLFFPAPFVPIVTTSTHFDYIASSTLTFNFQNGATTTSVITGPVINSFTLSTATSSSPTGCTGSPGATLTGCDQISTNNNMIASWSIQTGTTTLNNDTIPHNFYFYHYRSYLDTNTTLSGGGSTDAYSLPVNVSNATSTAPCVSDGITVSAVTGCTSASISTTGSQSDTYSDGLVHNSDSAHNGSLFGTFVSAASANNIGTIKVSVSPAVASTIFDGISNTSLTSVGSVSNPVDARSVLATADTASNGTTTTYNLQVNATGTCTTSCTTNASPARSIAFAAIKSYIFADVVGNDYSTITTTSTAAFSALASTACGTTSVNCYVSGATTSTREADFNSVIGKNAWYAYPKSLGSLDYTSLVDGMKVSTDDGASYPHNNEFSQSDIFLTNGGGVSTEYYLYGFDYSAGFGGIGSTDAWIKYP